MSRRLKWISATVALSGMLTAQTAAGMGSPELKADMLVEPDAVWTLAFAPQMMRSVARLKEERSSNHTDFSFAEAAASHFIVVPRGIFGGPSALEISQLASAKKAKPRTNYNEPGTLKETLGRKRHTRAKRR